MENSNPSNQETVGEQLIEDISQLECLALGEGVAVCEACGEELREGAPVVVFAFRPVDQPAFEIGHVKCTECRHEPTEYFTLGVRELVLDGRIGTCTNPVTQSWWPVLLAPQPRAVSLADATTVQPLPGATWFRRPIARSDVFAAADCASTRKPWQRPVVRADSLTHDGASESDAGSTTDDVTERTAQHAADGGRHGGVDDDVDADEDLDELHPVTSSLRTAQEQEGGADRVVEAGDGQAESKGSGGDGPGLDELAPVSSAVRTAQIPSDLDAAGDDGDAGASDEESGGGFGGGR